MKLVFVISFFAALSVARCGDFEVIPLLATDEKADAAAEELGKLAGNVDSKDLIFQLGGKLEQINGILKASSTILDQVKPTKDKLIAATKNLKTMIDGATITDAKSLAKLVENIASELYMGIYSPLVFSKDTPKELEQVPNMVDFTKTTEELLKKLSPLRCPVAPETCPKK